MKPLVTHYIPLDAPRLGGSRQLALCLTWANPKTQYSPTPTCEKCQEIIAREDAEIAALQEEMNS